MPKRTTYVVQIAASDAAKPSIVTDSVEPGRDGRLNGRLEFQDMDDQDMEISTDPSFEWGTGLKISKIPGGLTVGGAYSQETNPDPFAFYARHGGAAPATKSMRVHDSRAPAVT